MMVGTLAVVSIVVVSVIVLVVAYHLIGIFIALKRGADHLQVLVSGLRQIREDTAPLNAKVETVNGGLAALLEPLLGANDNLAAIVKVAARNAPARD